MRIIAGQWRGRRLVAPAGETTRPTADRVREALFSMLASRLGSFDGLRVADLFAGSGALGLEALSRGAAHCTFVEHDRAALAALRANVATFGADTEIRASAVEAIGPAGPFDLVLMDPPYGQGLAELALAAIVRNGWVAGGAIISVETGKSETIALAGFESLAERVHGKARLTLLRRT